MNHVYNYKKVFLYLFLGAISFSCKPWDLPNECTEGTPSLSVNSGSTVVATAGGVNATWSLVNSSGSIVLSNDGASLSFNSSFIPSGNYTIKAAGRNSCGFRFDLSQVYVKSNEVSIVGDAASVTAGSSVTIAVLANDLLNGVVLQRSSINAPSIVLQPTKGVVTVNPDGTLVYQSNPNASGTDVFRYQVCLANDAGACGVGEVGITILSDPNSIVDVEGNRYNTVVIGSQTWMKENLKAAKYSNGDLIPNPNLTESSVWSGLTTAAWCYIYDDPLNNAIYGKLYNFYVIEDPRKICPIGWRVPTEEDWQILEMSLGMPETQVVETGWRGTNEGSRLAGNALLWREGELKSAIGFGNTGFEALPAGFRYISGVQAFLGSATFFWSSTTTDNENAWVRNIANDNSGILRYPDFKRTGRSIRCLKE